MRHLRQAAICLLFLLVASCGGGDGGGDAGAAANVSISSPEDGAIVRSTFPVIMEADGFTIEPAGAVADGSGHFHLIVDAPCLAPGEQIPADETHLHLADGASETELSLPAGEHTLCLQAGDGQHAALALTDEITVTVAGESETTTQVEGREALQVWEGTYEGYVVWECQDGDRPVRGTLEGKDVAIGIWMDDPLSPFLTAEHTVTGSCLEGDGRNLTGTIFFGGRKTASGFTFPSSTWGVPGSFSLQVNGDRLEGRLRGEVASLGAGELRIDFDLECTFGC